MTRMRSRVRVSPRARRRPARATLQLAIGTRQFFFCRQSARAYFFFVQMRASYCTLDTSFRRCSWVFVGVRGCQQGLFLVVRALVLLEQVLLLAPGIHLIRRLCFSLLLLLLLLLAFALNIPPPSCIPPPTPPLPASRPASPPLQRRHASSASTAKMANTSPTNTWATWRIRPKPICSE